MSEPASDAYRCPRCRMVCGPMKIWCPACGRALPVAARGWVPPPMSEPRFVHREGPAFRLNSIGGLMIVIGVVAVVLAGFVANPMLGILTTLLAFLATVRLSLHLGVLRERGMTFSALEACGYLAASAALILLALVAAATAAWVPCHLIGAVIDHYFGFRGDLGYHIMMLVFGLGLFFSAFYFFGQLFLRDVAQDQDVRVRDLSRKRALGEDDL